VSVWWTARTFRPVPYPVRRMRSDKLLVWAAIVVGVILILLALEYWIEPARSLPSFFPGHEAGSNHHHVKHGIAAFLLGLACFAFAWFKSGPKQASSA
jgi:hypothetical protein